MHYKRRIQRQPEVKDVKDRSLVFADSFHTGVLPEFQPTMPPSLEADVLTTPLKSWLTEQHESGPAFVSVPKRSIVGVMVQGLADRGLTAFRSAEKARLCLLWRACADLLMMVSYDKPLKQRLLDQRWTTPGKRHGDMLHPDDLLPTIDALMKGKTWAVERMITDKEALSNLRRAISFTLRAYKNELATKLSIQHPNSFFTGEVVALYKEANKGERILKHTQIGESERLDITQRTYDNFRHVQNYYLYALLSGEDLAPRDGGLPFAMFMQAAAFCASVTNDGQYAFNSGKLETFNPAELPDHHIFYAALFYDRYAKHFYANDEKFKATVISFLKHLPDPLETRDPNGTAKTTARSAAPSKASKSVSAKPPKPKTASRVGAAPAHA